MSYRSVSPAKPLALRSGDTVAVVAPCAVVCREKLKRGVSVLEELGYRVDVSPHALDRDDIFAGTDQVRALELERYFADPRIKAIFVARGGYGCGRLLPLLNFQSLSTTPKIFLGFSDVTFLLNALVEKAGLVAFHGPMVAMDLARGVTPRSLSHLKDVLEGRIFPLRLEAQETLRAGVAEGLLIGGCLSVLVAMLGTPYAPSFEGKILLLEDVGEKPYRIDRMLTQLRQSGAFANVAGVVFGGMSGVDNDAQEKRLIRRFIQEQVCTLGVPVIAGLNVGHRTENLTVPLGVRVRLDADNCELCVVEPWVM